MPEIIKDLIEQLIDAARARGLSQAQLARMAGMTAVGLSKAKSRGDMRASTLQQLAQQLDMQLTLKPAQPTQDTLRAIRAGAFFRDNSSSHQEN